MSQPRDISPEHPVSFEADGVPVSEAFEDTFFSRSGGEAEVRHVFLRGNGLPERWARGGEFQIGELGFGTGLSFLATLSAWLESGHAGNGGHLSFTSFD
jgi:tRNA U34 5-methylaminomethyl-2-thiouridine-forming methyltransferase MnmC